MQCACERPGAGPVHVLCRRPKGDTIGAARVNGLACHTRATLEAVVLARCLRKLVQPHGEIVAVVGNS